MQNLGDTFGQVLRAIMANKMRSFLTMFGIAWGVGSMLLLIGVGEGFRSGQRRNMADFGKDMIMLWGGTIPAVPNQHTGMRHYNLTLDDAMALRTEATHVRRLTAFLNRSDIKQVSAYATVEGAVFGVDTDYPEIRTLPIAAGRFINQADLDEHRRVVVLGQKSVGLLFLGHPAIGESVLLNGTSFTVVGYCDRIGRGNNNTQNQQVYIPLTTMLELFPRKGENIPHDSLSSINYQPAVRGDNVVAVKQVHQIIARRHGFDPMAQDAFDEFDTIRNQQMVDTIFDAMNIFLGGVGLVTLALGAIGIVNIMLVSVSERTREIGLRKAIGATRRSILSQFFLEGLLLTGFSGIVGILGAAGFMYLLNIAIGDNSMGFDPPRLVPWAAALAILSLSLSGIFAGLYPASKAASLEPVEALRRE